MSLAETKAESDEVRKLRPFYLSAPEARALRRAPGWRYYASGGEVHTWRRDVNDWCLELDGNLYRNSHWSWCFCVWRDGHKLQWLYSAVKAKTPYGAMVRAEKMLRKFFLEQAKALETKRTE